MSKYNYEKIEDEKKMVTPNAKKAVSMIGDKVIVNDKIV